MVCRCALRIFKHSNADRRVDGEPLVKLSASVDRRVSVPCKGRFRSVDGRIENKCVREGRVKVERICIYKASS